MKYQLHYIGSKLYPKETFIKEAKTVGVNRCIPMFIIKKLKWNDRILLATHIPKEIPITYRIVSLIEKDMDTNEFLYWNNKDGWVDKQSADIFTVEEKEKFNLPIPQSSSIWEIVEVDKRKNKKDGIAEIFGYFQVTGLNYTASDDFKKELVGQLDIVSTCEPRTRVNRQCGSYVIGTSCIVKNSIEDIIEKALTLSDKRQEKVKFFIGGHFKELKLTLQPINFSRSLLEVDIDLTLNPDENTENAVGFLYDYTKRTYIKKETDKEKQGDMFQKGE